MRKPKMKPQTLIFHGLNKKGRSRIYGVFIVSNRRAYDAFMKLCKTGYNTWNVSAIMHRFKKAVKCLPWPPATQFVEISQAPLGNGLLEY
jgi:hypothetical protein